MKVTQLTKRAKFFFLVEGNIQWLKTEHFIKHCSNKTTYLCYLPKAVLCFHIILFKKENQQHTTNSKTLKQSYKTTNSKYVLSVVFRITRIKKSMINNEILKEDIF